MKPNIVKDEILDILESLQEQIPVLIDYTDKIPQIELDIVMSNVRKLYENINELKSIDRYEEEAEPDCDLAVPGKKAAVSSQQLAVGSQEDSGDSHGRVTVPEEEVAVAVAVAEEKKEEEVAVAGAVAGKKEEEVAGKKEEEVAEPVKIVFESKEEEIISPKKRQIEDK